MKISSRPISISTFFFTILIFHGSTSAQICPNDLYIGYYLEDPIANPEDPLPGSLHLSIPKTDGNFAGELFFTYVGCQTQNIGTVSGSKTGDTLNGLWSGNVDMTQQDGTFAGERDSNGFYSGSYTVTKGKQFIDIDDCIEYFIAPFGTWYLFPVLEESSDDDLISVDSEAIEWTPVANSVFTQCQLVELNQDNCAVAATSVWQEIQLSNTQTIELPKTLLASSNSYALSCAQFDENGNPLAFSKVIFDYPIANDETSTVINTPTLFLLLDEVE